MAHIKTLQSVCRNYYRRKAILNFQNMAADGASGGLFSTKGSAVRFCANLSVLPNQFRRLHSNRFLPLQVTRRYWVRTLKFVFNNNIGTTLISYFVVFIIAETRARLQFILSVVSALIASGNKTTFHSEGIGLTNISVKNRSVCLARAGAHFFSSNEVLPLLGTKVDIFSSWKNTKLQSFCKVKIMCRG